MIKNNLLILNFKQCTLPIPPNFCLFEDSKLAFKVLLNWLLKAWKWLPHNLDTLLWQDSKTLVSPEKVLARRQPQAWKRWTRSTMARSTGRETHHSEILRNKFPKRFRNTTWGEDVILCLNVIKFRALDTANHNPSTEVVFCRKCLPNCLPLHHLHWTTMYSRHRM